MIDLNIISRELKKEINAKAIYVSFKNLLALIFIILIFYAIALLVCLLILQIHFTKTVKDTTLLVRRTENYTTEVRQINNLIINTETIQADFVAWSYLLEYLQTLSNENIKISNIGVDKGEKAIALTGVAATRDSLLQLKETLEQSNYFSEINLPIKNLLERENINFSINTNLSAYEFK